MKKIFLSVALLPVLGLAEDTGQHEFDWLIGCWSTPDRSAQEVWVVDSDGSLVGFAASIRDSALSFYELLTIRETEDGSFVFTAHPAGQATTSFVATEITETGVVFTNGAHDYPQKISYFMEGDEFVATISMLDGDNMRAFRKSACE